MMKLSELKELTQKFHNLRLADENIEICLAAAYQDKENKELASLEIAGSTHPPHCLTYGHMPHCSPGPRYITPVYHRRVFKANE
ncbi:hypothetical protein V1478_009522 [Vespula squamosa]|uniref:Uncharacterized protein n=1 Tax=Vespula squamosa TaxID=30214 RepID=A0ABD2APW7_VESSQ